MIAAAMSKQILIVDDNRTLRNAVQRYLTRIGFDTSVATCGTDASHVLEQQAVDLVILDIGLPDCDGLEWLAEMRRRELAFPVVVVSCNAMGELQPDCAQPRAPTYLQKPFALSRLREAVEGALNT